jgi:hypothetical protein
MSVKRRRAKNRREVSRVIFGLLVAEVGFEPAIFG